MKCLLIKDYLFLKKSKFLHSMICFFLIPLFTAFNRDFFTYWGTVMCCSVPNIFAVEILNQDSRVGWGQYQSTLPIEKRVVVLEKYLLALIISICTIIFSCGSIGIKFLMNFYHDYDLTSGEVLAPMVIIAIVLAGNGIMLALYYRYGMTKQLSAGSLLLALICGAGAYFCDSIDVVLDIDIIGIIAVVLFAALAFFGFTCALSVRNYEKYGVAIK